MNVPFYTSVREYHNRKNEFDSAISSVMEKGDFILGSAVRELEEKIAAYSGAKHAIGCANGSDALVLLSDALGYKNGAEVITPVFTFFASTSCIARLGGKPVFCDIDEDTFCIDTEKTAELVTKNTRGILPVHLFCQMADMNAIMQIASENNLTVLEDAAEAFGMRQKIGDVTKVAGTVGDAGVYSFFPTKTLGGYGDGGMMVTDSEEIAAYVKSLRVHGATKKYHHEYVGYNSRLDTLQAAILQVKMQKINEGIASRKKIAMQYMQELNDVAANGQISLPVVRAYNTPVFYVFQIRAKKRDDLQNFLKENGIGTSVYYPVPLHLQKCFSHLGYKKGDFPIAEKACEEVLALPIFPELEKDEVSYVCSKIREFYK